MSSRRTDEGIRLAGALFALESRTLVVDEPDGRVENSLRVMLQDLHENYRCVAGLGGDATFEELEREAAARAAAGAVPERKAARVQRYAGRLDQIVKGAGASPKGGQIEIDERKLRPEDASVITRAWEQALDRIDLTTTVRADSGDVTSRLGCEDGHPPGPVLEFHGEMAKLGIACWNELIAIVLQLVATLSTLLRPSGRRAARNLWRLRMPEGLPAAAGRAERRRAKELFGQGGKLFLTKAPDGQRGGIRTLVQIDGDIVTRATLDSMLDERVVREHQAKIAAWFARLNRDWTWVRLVLGTTATSATGWFLFRDIAAFSIASWSDVVQFLSPLYPFAIRELIGITARRLILKAVTGPKALLGAT